MNYWLMKTEPGCFSLEMLKNRPDMTEPWDGVRNFQARNFMRDTMRTGDKAFFYHSNIPEPAVVGIVEIAREGYPDHTALDPQGEHFDPRATPANPVWFMVDVRFHQELPRPVTLEEIKANPLLADMPLVKRSRLSVQPVTAEEWGILLAMAGVQD